MVVVCAATCTTGSAPGSWQTQSKAKTGLFVGLGGAVFTGGALAWANWLVDVGDVVGEEQLAFHFEGRGSTRGRRVDSRAAWCSPALHDDVLPAVRADSALKHWMFLPAHDETHINIRMWRHPIIVPNNAKVARHGFALYPTDLRSSRGSISVGMRRAYVSAT